MGIDNIEVYTNGMKKSLLDKLFFIDKIESDFFIDYGCADGTMLQFMKNLFPNFTYVGYDNCDTMLDLAREKCKDIAFTNSWKDLEPYKIINDKTVILSSIMHEIYSYCSHNEIKEFWDRVFQFGFKYIIIRDMMVSDTSDRLSDINDIVKVINNVDKARLYEFESKWGKINNNKNLIHYLLKYRYVDNWNREVQENYLPISKEHLLTLIPYNYEIIFHEHYTLPYLKERVHRDFGIALTDNTHFKMILKRVG